MDGDSKPWSLWDAEDFNLHSDRMVNAKTLQIDWLSGNSFDVVVDREDFDIMVTGFDPNREIEVFCRRMN